MLALLRAHKTQASNARQRAIKAAAPYVSPNDPDAGLADHGFYRRVGGSARDMPASQQSTLNEQAMTMRRQNPLARRYIDLVRELMTQSDWTVTALEEPVQAVLDEFWSGPFNRWPEWIGSYGDVLHVTGVLALPVDVNRMDGTVACGYADPAEISQENRRTLQDLVRAIGRAVVTGDELEPVARVGEGPGETGDRVLDHLLLVEAGHDERDFGRRALGQRAVSGQAAIPSGARASPSGAPGTRPCHPIRDCAAGRARRACRRRRPR